MATNLTPAIPVPTSTALAELRDSGFAILRAALDPALIADLQADLEEDFANTPFGKGAFYGSRTRRFGRLLIRSPLAERLVRHPGVLDLVETLLLPFCERIQLNTAQAIAVHPRAPAQMPHRDQDMWQAPKGEIEYLVNVMWPLTPFREGNGATRIWPGSHGRAALDTEEPDECLVPDLDPGDALLVLGSTLHGAGANRTTAERRGIVIGYSLGWLKPYENQWLSYPPGLARSFSPDLASLVGYCQHRPNLGNFEGQCPSVLLGSHDGRRLGAIDALRPDQQAAVEAYEAAQKGGA
jgi:ectoine hydroxylase-related dioxygenase (phytanoyl-CoA dioxygenase family)